MDKKVEDITYRYDEDLGFYLEPVDEEEDFYDTLDA